MHEPTTLLVERARRLFLKQLRVPDHMAKRRAKVVGDRIGKRFYAFFADRAAKKWPLRGSLKLG